MNPLLSRTKLGRTQLQVTRLGFGAMEIRGPRIWRGRVVTEKQAETILNAVLDAGINFIDTSNDYGTSEEFIGKFISKRRQEYLLATKCGCTVKHVDEHRDDTPHVWTKQNLFRCLEESLKRMKTDYVDLMQLHGPSVQECKDGKLVEALIEMKAQGKVRWIGNSTTLPHLPEFMKTGVFDVFQIPYSMLEREHEAWISRAAEAGIGIIIRGGVAKGDYRPNDGVNARWQKYDSARLDELKPASESRSTFVLRYTLSHPHVHTIIAGTLNPEHLKENVAAVERGPLPVEIYKEVGQRLKALDSPVAVS